MNIIAITTRSDNNKLSLHLISHLINVLTTTRRLLQDNDFNMLPSQYKIDQKYTKVINKKQFINVNKSDVKREGGTN